jgi:hypothetical protein
MVLLDDPPGRMNTFRRGALAEAFPGKAYVGASRHLGAPMTKRVLRSEGRCPERSACRCWPTTTCTRTPASGSRCKT